MRAWLLATLVLPALIGVAAAADFNVGLVGTNVSTWAWSPSTVDIAPGDTVTFTWTGPHNIQFAGPALPVGGNCSTSGCVRTFQSGVYNFRCGVHPTTMTGVIKDPNSPDLRVESITQVEDGPNPAETTRHFTVVVKNHGTNTAAATTLRFALSGLTGEIGSASPNVFTPTIGPVAGGGSVSTSIDWPTGTKIGTWTARATADPTNVVGELDEANNVKSESVVVKVGGFPGVGV